MNEDDLKNKEDDDQVKVKMSTLYQPEVFDELWIHLNFALKYVIILIPTNFHLSDSNRRVDVLSFVHTRCLMFRRYFKGIFQNHKLHTYLLMFSLVKSTILLDLKKLFLKIRLAFYIISTYYCKFWHYIFTCWVKFTLYVFWLFKKNSKI